MDIKRDILLSVLCIVLLFISTTLLAISIQQEKVINKQNEIIVIQQEKAFTQQETIEVLNQLLEDEKLVSDTLYDLAVFHGILQEE